MKVKTNFKLHSGQSRFRGVYISSDRGGYESRIVIKGEDVYLGRYKNEKDAAKAYQKAIKEIFGEEISLERYRVEEEMNRYLTEIVNKIRGLRIKNKISQTVLANYLGLKRAFYGHKEIGMARFTTNEIIDAFSFFYENDLISSRELFNIKVNKYLTRKGFN